MIKVKSNMNLKYATPQSAGVDILSSENKYIQPNETTMISTGLYLEMPSDIEGQVRSRSGLAKNGIVVGNAPGTIDADYRGEIKILLYNRNNTAYEIKIGDRIAQLVFAYVCRPEIEITENFTDTIRGGGGFGSTGR